MNLYKDEVRCELARNLDINVAERQPFPGPGLGRADRWVNSRRSRVGVVREACAIVEEEFEAAAARGEMDLPWQYFAALAARSQRGCPRRRRGLRRRLRVVRGPVDGRHVRPVL